MVNDLLFPTVFMILNMPKDAETPLLLGKSFLATGRALINVELGELILRFNKENIVFSMFEAMKHHKESPQCHQIDIIEKVVQ